MKTAEDFRRDFGETEESFCSCVRQTLTVLESKEDEPVKKKINMGLVLALAVMLLTGTAMADERWGILSFLQNQGKTATEDQLLSLNRMPPFYPYGEQELVDAVMTEALYEDGKLYLAVTLTPLNENTMVAPMPDPNPDKKHMNLNSMSMRAAMQDDAYEDVSVLDYAKAHGFDHVVMVETYSTHVTSTQAHWSKDHFDGLEHVEYNLQEDGSLQFILQIGYQPNLAFADSDRMESASVSAWVYAYDLKEEGKWQYGNSTSASASFALHADRVHLRSIPEDAHDIVGYIGAMEYISIAPYDNQYMAITIQLNLRDDITEDTWMTGPAWIIMDADGNRLCEVDETKFYSLRTLTDENGDRLHISHGLFPVEYMPEDNKITLRAENYHNKTIVYDEHTYTLKHDQAAEEETLR